MEINKYKNINELHITQSTYIHVNMYLCDINTQ